jgi:hypothetical protein
MYRKLKELGLIKIEYDGIDLGEDEIDLERMNSSLNYLITDDYFRKKLETETNEEYKFRISYHEFIINSTKIRGDMAKTLTYMMINRLKLNCVYDDDYEKILNKIEKMYNESD